MKYLCIGDLHGRLEYATLLLSDKFKEYHKVFVGDYVDSFTEGREKQLRLVRLLLEASDREDVTCLIGNHELSYLKQGMRCSGWGSTTQYGMNHLRNLIFEKFVTHKWLTDTILVTHAGANGLVFDSKDDITEALATDDKRLYNIGYYRGGTNTYGGIYWCDFWAEFEEIEGIIQIVGHTAARPLRAEGVVGVVEMDNCFNVDCLDNVPEALIVDTEAESNEVFSIVNFESMETDSV